MASPNRFIDVFDQVRARPVGPERDRFLSEVRRDDPAHQVISLIEAHEAAGDFLRKPAHSANGLELEQIGEGGCGAARALELLRDPTARRFKDLAHLKTDPDLDALRSREDFRRFLDELEAKPDTPSGQETK